MDKEKCTEDWLLPVGADFILYQFGTGASDCGCGQRPMYNPWEGQLFHVTFLLFLGKNLPYPLFIQGMVVDAVFSYNCRNLLFVFGTG